MKNKTRIAALYATMLILALGITTTPSFAQTESHPSSKGGCCMMKDCCIMKDGKMMQMKGGKMMPMESDMTMVNGTKCTTKGECIMKDGKKMKMKEGQCMDMDGKMMKCDMRKDAKCCKEQKHDEHCKAANYDCPMHPEVTSDKAGKCSKCGMDLLKKKN